ncbi:hypothetical protein HDU97_003576 [Phlyctochytrium planicorne]|nr:hypothetical protein HDU97_003576 [Phlyctochytrium planicorne]
MNNFAQKEFYSIVVGASVLAANAGYINVVTLAGVFSVTVSHVTGNVSKVAIAMITGDVTMFAVVTSILFSFMFGAFVAGYMVGDHKFQLGLTYGYALLLEALMLFLSMVTLRRELIVGEWCAAFACGLQNALATSYSGAVVRTTHMTGICTDIGNILGQACRTDSNAELWRLKVHVPILFSFMFGGLFGQIAYASLHIQSMWIPCILTGTIGATYLSLPFIQQAAKSVSELAAIRKATQQDGQPGVEVRFIGDPRKHGGSAIAKGTVAPNGTIVVTDRYAHIHDRDLDAEIKQFYDDLGDDEENGGPAMSERKSEISGFKKNTSTANDGVRYSIGGGDESVGQSVEVLYNPGTPAKP